MPERMNKGNDFGKEAEKIAVDYLASNGYVINKTNWKISGIVEIDIIASKGSDMIFVEVKARSGHWEEPESAIDERKIRKLVQGADIYLRNQKHNFNYRFDIIAITGSKDDYHLSHYEDAFLSPVSQPRKR